MKKKDNQETDKLPQGTSEANEQVTSTENGTSPELLEPGKEVVSQDKANLTGYDAGLDDLPEGNLKDQLIKVFTGHPRMNRVYVSSDNVIFAQATDAKNHQKVVDKNLLVLTVNR